jgi:D-glycero-D-manno-heptose 1,7-bisphosphate phosphatase
VTHPAIFLDRDGTLIEEVGYATRPEQIRILGGAARALARLADAGYKLVVVTNQSGIARGYLTEEDLNRFHQALDEQLELLGARIDAYYTCPHLPDPAQAARADLAVDCDCRKPRPGLILLAARDLDIDLASSWMIGDTWRDIEAGQAAGVRTVKLPADAAHDSPRPPHVSPPTGEAENLDAAVDFIGRPSRESPQAPSEPSQPPEEPPGDEPSQATAEPPGPDPSQEPAEPPSAGATFTFAEPAASAPAVESPPAAPPPEPSAAPAAPAQPPPAAPVPSPPTAPAEAPAAAIETPARAALRERPERAAPARPPPAQPQAACARCGQVIRAADVLAGTAARRNGLLMCADCLAQQPGAGADRVPEGTADLLRAILLELRRVGRARQAAGFSFLRLSAYVVQAGALFCGLVLGLVGGGPDRAAYLQVAILLQLVVLALLLAERHS